MATLTPLSLELLPSQLPTIYDMNISARFDAFHKRSKRQKPQEPCPGLLSQMLSEKSPKGSANVCHLRTVTALGTIFLLMFMSTTNTVGSNNATILLWTRYDCFCIG
ncbi:MAG: hypothetical protein QOI53_1213 [Verrucomicrobiota bacterium]|nr:hypothetical protein [Verrucomicrobiota bacterium]